MLGLHWAKIAATKLLGTSVFPWCDPPSIPLWAKCPNKFCSVILLTLCCCNSPSVGEGTPFDLFFLLFTRPLSFHGSIFCRVWRPPPMMPRPPSPSLGGSLHWWRFFIMDPFFWTSRLLTFASGSDFYGMDGFISDKSWFSPLVDVKLFSMLDTVMYHVVTVIYG